MSNAQELLCNVRVNSSQVQTSDRKVFQTMQSEIYEFINNKIWTSTKIENEETKAIIANKSIPPIRLLLFFSPIFWAMNLSVFFIAILFLFILIILV